MTPQEYIDKRNELNETISNAKHELAKMKHQYISEHCDYKIGDKVHVIVPEYVDKFYPRQGQVIEREEYDAFVTQSINIDDEGRCWPTLHKMKKDGTESIQYHLLPRQSEPIITKIR